jgi:predicted negative regulator of RcsB-dependent stress response
MNRPKKNKIHNPTLPDDAQDIVDERHLIDAGESEEVSIEDRISIYWMENKGFISGCIFVLALLIIGFNGMRIYKNHAEAELQAAYAEAMANETLADFAQANANKDLGGLAGLTVADQAYAAEEFEKALNFYTIAADALSGNILEGRARLGQAFALFYTGKQDEGLAQLANIAADSNLAEAARAEAAYHLAVEANVAGRAEDYDRYVAQIQAMPTATQWQQRLTIYEQQARL